ncbi:reverse transcriptase domain-containing protein [Tanacetum coccineum]
MRTRSSSNLIVESSTIPKRRNRRRSKKIVKPELRTIIETLVDTMADTHTMSELLQAPTEGYGDAIVIPAILAKNFELKVRLLTLVTLSQFHGFERDDPHSHIRWFNKITSTLKYKNVPHEAIKLMLFPFSLERAARIWLEKVPPRSIYTWEDLVSKFVNYFFPPSKTTNLKNDITNFQQRFDETFSEAWDRFKDLLRKCDQDSLNAAAGGNLLNRTPRDALTIIENKSKVCTSRNKPVISKASTTSSSTPAYLPEITALTDAIKAMLFQNKTPSPASVNAIEEIYVTCGGPYPYYECHVTNGNTFNASATTGTYNQGGLGYRPQGETNYRASNQIRPPGFPQPNVQNNQNWYNQSDLKDITTRSGVSYDGPTIPPTSSPLLKEVEREPEATKDKVQTKNLGSTAHVQPPVVQVPIPEPDVALKPNLKLSIPYPSRLNDQKLREKANYQMLKFLQIFQKLHFDLSFVDALLHIPKFAFTFKSLLHNKEKLFELANTPLNLNCSAVLLKKLPEKLGDPSKFLIPCDFLELDKCLALADLGASINLMPLFVWKKLSLPKLTPTRMTLELATRTVANSAGIAKDVCVQVGKFTFPADFVIIDYDADPRVPLILGRPFLRTTRALVDVHREELILRDGDEKLIFHADSTLKHPHTHGNESINMINFIDITCEDRFPQMLKLKNLNHPSSGSTTPLSDSLPSLIPFETSDSLLKEFADELALLEPFPSGIGDADFDSEGYILLLENNDESLPEEDVPEENFKIYSNPLFEFDDEYISSGKNPLFNEVLEDIENKDSYVSNLDELALLVTPLFDANEDECFDPGGDIDEIDADVSMDIKDGYHDSEGDIIYLESLFINDTIPNLPPEVFLDHDPKSLNDEPKIDNLKIKENVRFTFEDCHYLSLTFVIKIFLPFLTYPVNSLLFLSSRCEDTIFDPGISAYSFYSLEPGTYESSMMNFPFFCFCPKDKGIWGRVRLLTRLTKTSASREATRVSIFFFYFLISVTRRLASSFLLFRSLCFMFRIAPDYEDFCARGFVHRSLEL